MLCAPRSERKKNRSKSVQRMGKGNWERKGWREREREREVLRRRRKRPIKIKKH